MWVKSEMQTETEKPKARTEAKTDIPKKAHGEVAAEKAQRQAEKAKDEDDSKDQTSGAAGDDEDQPEPSGHTSPSGTTVTGKPISSSSSATTWLRLKPGWTDAPLQRTRSGRPNCTRSATL